MRVPSVCAVILAAFPLLADMPWARGKGTELTRIIEHHPQVRTPLDQIAFADPSGPCGDMLADLLVADFSASGTLVVDRLNLKRIMAEHRFNLGGAVDSKTAARLGRLIGAGSLMFVKAHECTTRKSLVLKEVVDGKNVKRMQIPTTFATVRASIQLTNLTTGVTAAARVVNAKGSLGANEMDKSRFARLKDAAFSLKDGATKYDEYPPEDDVKALAMLEAVKEVHALLFPWTETKKFVLFEDKDCSLHVAVRLARGGDYEGAAREAQAGVDTCAASTSVKPVTRARAHYNRGMLRYLTEDYAGAIADFSQAARLDDDKLFTEIMAECNRARLEALTKSTSPGRNSNRTSGDH
jgi:TolA-binding protein